MNRRKNIFILLLFSLTLFFPFPVFAADRETAMEIAAEKAQAKMASESYLADLHDKISKEKSEIISKPGDKLSLRTSGSLKNETALRISEPCELTKIRNQIILSETGKLSENLHFKVSGRGYYDAVFALTDNFPRNVRSDEQSELEFRDTYLDMSSGPFDVRLGKQQVVWGEAVALFFADAVNARDLREFILPDFDMIRIPQWGADVEFSKENFHAEIVWLPILEFDKLGVPGSEFAFPYPLPSANTPFTARDASHPKNSFNNSEAGLRLSYLLSGWDLSAFYLRTWNKSPVAYRTINSGVFNFSPEYKRLDAFGATFSKEINDVVLKGELLFNKDDYFSTLDINDADGVVRRNSLNYLLGVNYTLFKKLDMDLQFMQNVIFDYPGSLFGQKELRNSLALWMKTGFFDNKFEPEFTVVTSLTDIDVMYRPRLNFKFKDNWTCRLGADIFQGDSSGFFGRFDKKSRCYSEIMYSF